MAARAIGKKIYVNSQALSMIRVFVSPGIDRTRWSCSELVKATVKTLSAVDESKTRKDVGDNVIKVKALVCDDVWKTKIVEEIEETGLKLLELLQKLRDEEEEIFIDSNDKVVNYMKPIYELWSKKIEEEERKLLQEGWTHLRDSLLGTAGLETCHHRSLLSIQHHIGSENAKFATASPHTGLIDVRRLALQRPGPYGLPRQVVMGVVCITTKDAFLLYDPTTGDTSPWIETTTTRKGKARRQVESIALGYHNQFGEQCHKVVCISRNVKKRSAPEPINEFLVVEILTVRDRTWDIGEHQWRKLESTPHSFVNGDKFVFLDGPLYLDGTIYWQCRYQRLHESILEFDIEREVFIHIPISKFLIQEFMDSSKHMWSMLMEVDGKLAILKSTSDQETSSLWICYHSPGRCGDVKWSKEKIPVPYTYVVSPGFSIEALRRKDLIFIRSRRRISYYNRKTKVSLSLKIPTSPIHDHFDCGRMIQM